MVASVAAVIVTYEPEPRALERLLDRLASEVGEVIVVDNGSAFDVAGLLAVRSRAQERLLPLGSNFGIAAAQNRGIEAARAAGADAVILFDQDSLPPTGMLATLAAALAMLQTTGRKPAAVGPVPIDARLSPRRAEASETTGPLAVDHLIASGCLIPLPILDDVGPMREELFIDYVDIEWCLRAAAHGYRCYRVPAARMAHEFGSPLTVLGHAYASHSPMRHYYLFRNSAWLWQQVSIPWGWRLKTAPRIISRLAFNALFAKPHRQQWRMMLRGLRDGFAGRLGRGHD
ncbi:MAG: glycosyltransferase family 2 protein [Devosia sp.]|nr:glycosyltransferase family 2 protein [Devosia sp.]